MKTEKEKFVHVVDVQQWVIYLTKIKLWIHLMMMDGFIQAELYIFLHYLIYLDITACLHKTSYWFKLITS